MYTNWVVSIFAVIIAILIVLSTVSRMNMGTIATLIIAITLALIIVDNINGVDYYGSLPPTTYPPPPHLGLDGVSLSNIYAGVPLN